MRRQAGLAERQGYGYAGGRRLYFSHDADANANAKTSLRNKQGSCRIRKCECHIHVVSVFVREDPAEGATRS